MRQNHVTPANGTPSSTLLGAAPLALLRAQAAASSGDEARSTGHGRTTVLPRRHDPRGLADVAPRPRPRFEAVRLLGRGAMGEVELALDHDIRRRVAVKRILDAGSSPDAVMRFADEVRVVGQLEHPGIVPIYDVGQDEGGELYAVMKHLQGETMESILGKLRAGDPATRARFTLDYRLHLFFAVLDAMRYAHARGILHRDLKPENIQIGPYGEVTVLDWGIARPFRRSERALTVEPLERTALGSLDQRLVETHVGALAGTPLYMSPEQAAGHTDDLDDRSDVYALCVVLYEWLTLEHPSPRRGTLIETLAATIYQDHDPRELLARAAAAHVPVEYVHILAAGLRRQRHERLGSVAELDDALKRARDGFVAVQCPVTLGKHVVYGFARWIDRHPTLYSALLFGGVGALVGGLGYALLGL